MQISRLADTPAAASPRPVSVVTNQPALGAKLKGLSRLSLLYVVADMLNRGSAILLLPIYTRFMSPGDYGILALASLISSLLVMVLTFGGSSVVLRFYHHYTDQEERSRFLGSFWLFLVIFPGAVIALLYLVGQSVISVLFAGLPLHPYFEMILGIAYVNIAAGTLFPSLLRAREQGRQYLALSGVTTLLTLGLTLILVVGARLGAAGALGAQLGALALVGVASSLLLVRDLRPAFSFRSIAAALRYGLPLVPHFAAHWTLSISDRAILGRFVGLGSVGLYSLAYQFGTVMQLLMSSVNQALAPSFSRAAHDREDLGTLSRIVTYYYGIVALLGLTVALTAKHIIALVTPPSYHTAGDLVPFIALGVAAMGFYLIPMNLLSLTAGNTGMVPAITLAAGAANVGLNLLTVPLWGPTAAAVNTAVGYGLLAVLTTLYAQHVIALAYEKLRIARLCVVSLLLYAVGQLFHTTSAPLGLLFSLLLVASFPLALLTTGFFTRAEKEGLAHLLGVCNAQIRTIITRD